jgi:DNA-binding MarR family transcriptional regulator
LNAIKHDPWINQKELIAKTSLKRHILTYNLAKLIELDLVRKINYERNVCYEYVTNELLQNEILKVLVIKLLNNEIDEQTFLKLKDKLR